MTRKRFFESRQSAIPIRAIIAVALVLIFGSPRIANADDIENLFNQEMVETAPTPAPATPPPGGTAGAPAPAPTPEAAPAPNLPTPKRVADLGKLEKFDDIAVIQKRYLPRTQRFEIFVGPTLVLNDAFFLNFGANIRLAYHFSERYGVEAVGDYLSTNERQVTTDLREKRAVITRSFVTPQTYAGLDFKWSPIYGKMTWMNRRIVPFDLYFSLGGGITGTNQNSSELTAHLGTGQIFAQTKGIAWRWDFSWNAFRATSSLTPSAGPSLYHNLLLTFGASFYFPEANYR